MKILMKQKAEIERRSGEIHMLTVFSRLVKLVSATLVLLTFQAKAQVVTLDSLLAVIDRQNPMLQEYDYKVRALDAYAEGAKSWMAPMVGVGPYWYPYPGKTVMSEAEKGMFMINLEQDIPNPAKLKAKRNYYASKAKVEQQARAVQYNALRSEAKTFYYKWLVAEKKHSVLKENERIIELMLKLARIRYPYNQGSLGNIYKVEGRLHEVQNMMLMTAADKQESSYRLKSLMNLNPTDSMMVDTTTSVHFDPNEIAYDTASLRERRSDVKQINQSIEVMRLNQQFQRVQAKPDFKIRLEHMDPRGQGMPNQFSAMAMVTIPIAPWSSKMYKSEVRGMQYDIEAMRKERESVLIESRGMLAGMATQLSSMQKQLANYHTKIIPALRKNYETLILAYEENREQLPIVIDGWEALNMTQMEYLNKLESYYNMIISYEKALEK
ncbi:TolC family protein [Chryseolinea sp. H1M3-3]|uniref:TolC family protein n=1 Tax=Chryseolinea sp. H1M3-3 TaxID=3034144 RepID=UPI0023EAC53F|nr:TolC family protein [Chryseolinea sp. H1M3-3]